ncbi:MAG: helix-turn-helix domain-containing protein [Bdellovibrionales bacterium]|nr:helix-turn-helix domain-containing protein [Bdellovibrionales bacterium]
MGACAWISEPRPVSWEAQSAVWAHSQAKGNALLTLLAIADFLNRETHLAWPSVETLAKRTRQTERNVRYSLKSLRESGEISVVDGAGPRGVNCYTINLPYEGRPSDLTLQNFQGENLAGLKNGAGDPEKIAPNPLNPNISISDDQGATSDAVQLELELWPRVLGLLRQRVQKATFEEWLRKTQLRHYERGHLVVSVPSPMAAEFLTARILPLVEEAVAQETGEPCTIEFRVA